MAVHDNAMDATVFWNRLPLSSVLTIAIFVVLDFDLRGAALLGLSVVEQAVLIAVIFFLLSQLAFHPLMARVYTQSFGRAPARLDLQADHVSLWFSPLGPKRPGGGEAPLLLELPYANLISVNTFGIPGAMAPFSPFRTEGLSVPDGVFLRKEATAQVLALTRANAQRLRAAQAAWKKGQPVGVPPAPVA